MQTYRVVTESRLMILVVYLVRNGALFRFIILKQKYDLD
jgi:hypothetical protein